MARWLYCCVLYLGAPLVWLRLFWRSRKQPAYARHLGERWGYFPTPPPGPLLWVHAVSVGETRAAQPLIESLLAAYPDHRVLLTGMTPTGREAATALYPSRVVQAYLPYDYPGAMARFFVHFQPCLGVLMETEIWPNLLATAQRRGVPMVLVNARLSARSARGYQRFASLARPALASLAGVAAQTEADAERLRRVGAQRVTVVGNLKFDVAPAAALVAQGRAWRTQIGARPIWLAASTRDGEEALILDALATLAGRNVLLVLVPRHPQRFDAVADLTASRGWRWERRTAGLPAPDTEVWIGDSMGEMVAYYSLADCCFIGGSLLPLGGQNLIEAAACGCPVLIGPHTFNFKQAAEDAIAAGAACRIASVAELGAEVASLVADAPRRAAMVAAAHRFSAAHSGAARRTLDFIARWL